MGNFKNITKDLFPTQSEGKLVNLCFHYDTKNSVLALELRHDMEEPFCHIFQEIVSKRLIRAEECQYRYIKKGELDEL